MCDIPEEFIETEHHAKARLQADPKSKKSRIAAACELFMEPAERDMEEDDADPVNASSSPSASCTT